MPSFGFGITFIQRVFPKSRGGLAAFHSSKLEVFLSKPLVLFHGLVKHSMRGSKPLGGWFQLAQGKIKAIPPPGSGDFVIQVHSHFCWSC